jgi:hypothetical protein
MNLVAAVMALAVLKPMRAAHHAAMEARIATPAVAG